MLKKIWFGIFVFALIFPAAAADASAQKKKQTAAAQKPIMWEKVNIKQRDLFYGPGGREMQPDLTKITFIEEKKNGHNKKYLIRDGAGREWVAKFGSEAKPETAAVRLMWALGYKTEINYLVPELTIPGKGTFKNVRLEARPAHIERLEEWKWEKNPFIGTNEFQGLKIMMVFIKNWDIVNVQNKILEVKGPQGKEIHYIVSDLGGTFGRLGNNNFPIIYRFGRSTGKPQHYKKTILIREVENKEIELSYKGKNRWIFDDITVGNAEWLYGLLSQLSDKQIGDAFRAANYTPAEVRIMIGAVRSKINELARVSNGQNIARK